MIVCLCRGVPERTVRLAVVSGAGSIEDVADVCGAGSGCGACHQEIERLLAEEGGGSPAGPCRGPCAEAILLAARPTATRGTP
jgi:bacterioferritin-associated ferredoxin